MNIKELDRVTTLRLIAMKMDELREHSDGDEWKSVKDRVYDQFNEYPYNLMSTNDLRESLQDLIKEDLELDDEDDGDSEETQKAVEKWVETGVPLLAENDHYMWLISHKTDEEVIAYLEDRIKSFKKG